MAQIVGCFCISRSHKELRRNRRHRRRSLFWSGVFGLRQETYTFSPGAPKSRRELSESLFNRLFCIETSQRGPLELDFGCPYGCDDNGEPTGSMLVRQAGQGDSNVPDKGGIRDRKIVLVLCSGDFEASMHRKPRDQAEFDEWARLAEKGLLNGHIDWDIIYECTAEAMKDGGDGE